LDFRNGEREGVDVMRTIRECEEHDGKDRGRQHAAVRRKIVSANARRSHGLAAEKYRIGKRRTSRLVSGAKCGFFL
jgi:hypothetical protein